MNNLEKNMIAWATDCSELAMSFYRRTGDLEFKREREAVTEADRQIERFLRQKIKKCYPDDAIVGEEFGGTEAVPGQRVWQLDPIDGTLNFALGLPGFCTSMAVLDGENILAACIFQPTTGDCFSASAGQGARLNGKAIEVSKRHPLSEAVISTHFKKYGRFVQNPGLLQAMALAPLKCRRTGAIALELAWVASGGTDALVGGFESTIHLWDVAAGLLLIEEAGGLITDHRGQPYLAGCPDLIVSNGLIHQEILDLIGKFPSEL